MLVPLLFLLCFVLSLICLSSAGNVALCKELTSCTACADSYVHVLGFKEQCRWCVETQSCGGPLACPMGAPVVQREPFRCPVKHSSAKGRRYTDALGRSIYAVAMSTKAANISDCLSSVRPDIKLIKSYTVDCDASSNSCTGLLAVSEEAKAIYVAYRGTSFDKQLLAEFMHGVAAQLGAWEKFENSPDEEAGAGVITYFHTAFYRLFVDSGMKDDLLEQVEKNSTYRIWITGHSLGGSLASMTALYLAKATTLDSSKIRLITFGEPRTGNVAFAKELEQHIQFRYRVVKKNDAITNLPASLDPNTPLLTASLYERQPLFYRYLVHYDNAMKRGDKFKICSLSDDHACRNLALAADFSDHTSYFGISSEDFVKAECPPSMLL